MKKILVLCALIASPALATTTWTSDDNGLVSIATCTTGSESAPTLATQGLSLTGVKGFTVVADTASAMTAGGFLRAYVYVTEITSWVRAPDLDLSVQALTDQAFPGFSVSTPRGRVAFIPDGVGVAVTVYVLASK